MSNVKDSVLYKTLKKAVRKQDHAELLRMLTLVDSKAIHGPMRGFVSPRLTYAFWWEDTPQGNRYWSDLSKSLSEAGHDCH